MRRIRSVGEQADAHTDGLANGGGRASRGGSAARMPNSLSIIGIIFPGLGANIGQNFDTKRILFIPFPSSRTLVFHGILVTADGTKKQICSNPT